MVSSLARSQGSNAWITGREFSWRSARRASASRPRISPSMAYSALIRSRASLAMGAGPAAAELQ